MPKLTNAQNRVLAHIGTDWATYAEIFQADGKRGNIFATLGALENAGVIERRVFETDSAGRGRPPEWRRIR